LYSFLRTGKTVDIVTIYIASTTFPTKMIAQLIA